MARPSTIDRLPQEIKESIGRLRQAGRGIDEILAHLDQLGADVSRSALGRHVQKLDVIGARMRESRDMAEALASRFGEETDDKLARVNAQLLHGILFQTLGALHDTDDDENGQPRQIVLDSKDAKQFAEAMRSLSTAQATDAARILKVQEAARRKAAEAAGRAAKSQGLGKGTVDFIMSAVLGVEAP